MQRAVVKGLLFVLPESSSKLLHVPIYHFLVDQLCHNSLTCLCMTDLTEVS